MALSMWTKTMKEKEPWNERKKIPLPGIGSASGRTEPVPVNAKSVVRILAEGIGQGTKIEIAAEGTDEEQAAASLAALVESGFGE